MKTITGSKVHLSVLTPEKLEKIKSKDFKFYNALLRASIHLKGSLLAVTVPEKLFIKHIIKYKLGIKHEKYKNNCGKAP